MSCSCFLICFQRRDERQAARRCSAGLEGARGGAGCAAVVDRGGAGGIGQDGTADSALSETAGAESVTSRSRCWRSRLRRRRRQEMRERVMEQLESCCARSAAEARREFERETRELAEAVLREGCSAGVGTAGTVREGCGCGRSIRCARRLRGRCRCCREAAADCAGGGCGAAVSRGGAADADAAGRQRCGAG